MRLLAPTGGLFDEHNYHTLTAAVMAATVLAVLLGQLRPGRRRQRPGSGRNGPRRSPSPRTGRLLTGLALAVLGAATVHLAATPVHLHEGPVLGGFFLTLSILQFCYAAAVVIRPGETLLRAGLVANAAVVALWVYTRTVGIPFGVGGGEVEAIGLPDLLATVFELATVPLAVMAWRRLRGERGLGRLRLTQTQLGYALAIVACTGAIVSTTGIS